MSIEVLAIDQMMDMNVPENKLISAFYFAALEVENERITLNIKKRMHKARQQGGGWGLFLNAKSIKHGIPEFFKKIFYMQSFCKGSHFSCRSYLTLKAHLFFQRKTHCS